jgi:hypothetical protein
MKDNALAAGIGQALKHFRETRSLRQDDVARAARRAGLQWTRSVVVALEAGRRDLTIDEFPRLTMLLEHLGVARGNAMVSLVNRGAYAELKVASILEGGLELPSETPAPVERARRIWRAVAPRALWLDVEAAHQAAGGDLEQKIGRRLRLDPLAVALVARQTWGSSLTDERDRRVGEQAPPGMPPRALQALRGHVTRALLQELTPGLTEARARLRKKGGRS